MPAAGRLDRRIVIQRKVETRSSTGAIIETWTPWKTVWMGKDDVRADERFRADQELAERTTVWTSHYIPELRADDRLVEGDTVYDILGIAEIGRRAGHQITATAVRV